MDQPDKLARRGVISRAAFDKLTHDVTVYIVRHGATKLNNDTDTSVDRIRGWANVPLADEGRQEARKAAAKLKSCDIDVIMSSDLDRAAETADIIGKIIGLKPELSQKLRPWNLGKFTGTVTKEALPQIAKYACDKPDTPVPEGESFHQFAARAFEGFYEAVARHPGKTVVIVTHHRDERLIEAWDKEGQPNDHTIDIQTFLAKGDPPGGIKILTTTLAALKGKLTHAQAGYRAASQSTGRDRCANCKAFEGVNDCKKVKPPIAPTGWCRVGISKLDGHAFSPTAHEIG
jgi:broad specificity phosphatase PhoE